MTDQTIIDDAKADAGKQEQEPVAWMNGNLEYDDLVTNADKNNMFHANYAFYQKHLTIPLFTAPPQPQTVADALEMALNRMDRARNILTNGKPSRECNWGMLDTSDIRNLITTQPTQMQIPDGYKLVPIEITEAMHIAAVKTIIKCTGNDDFPPRVYKAMLNAAPSIQGNAEGDK